MPLSVLFASPDGSRPRKVPYRAGVRMLSTLALALVLAATWTPHTASAQHADNHPVVVPTGHPPEEGVQADHHAEDDSAHSEATPHGDAESHTDTHTNADAPAHTDEATAAHADEGEGHEAGGGHDADTPTVSSRTKSVVLGGFAGVNVLAVLTAGFLRRQTPPRLPKHLQR